MNTKTEIEQQIVSIQRQIEGLQNKKKEIEESLQTLEKPERVYSARIGDTMSDGTLLLDVIYNKDQSIAILAAPIENMKTCLSNQIEEYRNSLIEPLKWFIPDSSQLERFVPRISELPCGNYWCSDGLGVIETNSEYNEMEFSLLKNYTDTSPFTAYVLFVKFEYVSSHPFDNERYRY